MYVAVNAAKYYIRKLDDGKDLVVRRLSRGRNVELKVGDRKVTFEKGDITLQRTDAIVNAANSSLMGGGGVDGAIHRAGGPMILEGCRRIVAERGRLPAGKAVITGGGKLPCRFVIHTVGPVWQGGNNQEAAVLGSAYAESLHVAEDNHLETVAFPSISTGAYGYPLAEAARVAVTSVRDFLRDRAVTVQRVSFILFDERTLHIYETAAKESAA